MSDSTYYYRTLGRVFMHEKPNLCPSCKHRQEYGEWQGYCNINNKILSSAIGLHQKGRCKEYEVMADNPSIEGKRRDLAEDDYNLSAGEYGKAANGKWYCRVPDERFPVGGLSKHHIKEHHDGTISAYPSIVSENEHGEIWHGYLECGIWRQV